MAGYLIRRLTLLPLTLLVVLLVNFIILNLAPGDPSTLSGAALQGDGAQEAGKGGEFERDDQYLIFREHYGLTLPILLNTWPWMTQQEVLRDLLIIDSRRKPGASTDLSPQKYKEFRVRFGDRARYMLPQLLQCALDTSQAVSIRQLAIRFFIRGATRMGVVDPKLSSAQHLDNQEIASSNRYVRSLLSPTLPLDETAAKLQVWYQDNARFFPCELTTAQCFSLLFFDTRISRYMKRVFTLDFGSLRNNINRSVVSEVGKRMKYSLTLAILPLVLTFFLCQCFGFIMACYQNRWPDYGLNMLFLILYAVPVFVVAPFLIEKIALPQGFPMSGFHSDEMVYQGMNSWQRLRDVMAHLALPLIAVTYGTLAVEARLCRTAVLEVMRQDYVRTARAKGVPPLTILYKHVGRNASITIVTAIATQLGTVLAGSLIVETIFGIDGFGRFFYEAIVNRDYNVILFSTLASALLALVGYLLADFAYMLLDPRISVQ